jgi:hypothetical protein
LAESKLVGQGFISDKVLLHFAEVGENGLNFSCNAVV